MGEYMKQAFSGLIRLTAIGFTILVYVFFLAHFFKPPVETQNTASVYPEGSSPPLESRGQQSPAPGYKPPPPRLTTASHIIDLPKGVRSPGNSLLLKVPLLIRDEHGNQVMRDFYVRVDRLDDSHVRLTPDHTIGFVTGELLAHIFESLKQFIVRALGGLQQMGKGYEKVERQYRDLSHTEPIIIPQTALANLEKQEKDYAPDTKTNEETYRPRYVPYPSTPR
jgi:hypothetical protein